MADTVAELVQRGWHLSDVGLEECTDYGKRGVQETVKAALDFDLKIIGKKCLPEDINKGKLESIDGPLVLQIQKIRNISAPKDNEDSQTAPRLLKISLSDGHVTCNAIEAETLTQISLDTPPGKKVLLSGNVRLNNSFLQLTNNNTKVLGGHVEKMVESWQLKRTLASQSRSTTRGEDGPPPFIPFGQRVDRNRYNDRRNKDNFKSLESNKPQKKAEDDEFEQQRQATIAEAIQAKDDGKAKNFTKQVSDKDVEKIVEMGFSPEQAVSALKQSGNNVEEAINTLLATNRTGYNRDFGRDGFRGRGRGQDRGDRLERGFGRGRRGDEDGYEPSRPSQNISLFDFLEKKIPVKEESNKENHQSERTRHKSDPKQSQFNKPTNLPPRLLKLQAQRELSESLSTKNKEAYPELTSAKSDGRKNVEKRESRNAPSKNIGRDGEEKSHTEAPTGNRGRNNEHTGRGGYNNTRGHRYDNRQGDSNHHDGRSHGMRNNDYSRQDQNFDRQNRHGSGRASQQDGRYQGDRQRYQGRNNYNDGSRYQDRNDSRQYNDKRPNDRPRNQKWQSPPQQNQFQHPPPHFNQNQSGYNPQQNRYSNSRSSYDGQQKRPYNNPKQAVVDNKPVPPPPQVPSEPPVVYSEPQVYENPPPMAMPQPMPPQEAVIMSQPYSTQYIVVSQSEDMPVIYTQAITESEYVQQHQPQQHMQMYAQANGPAYIGPPTGHNSQQWKQGDYCLARYWEDNQFYKAVIHNIYINGNGVCVALVQFVDYGNTEEVAIEDVKPISKESWGDTQIISQPQFIMPTGAIMAPPQMVSEPYQGFIGSMEFTRGGNGVPVSDTNCRQQRPSQLYQPQPYRS